MLTYHLGWSSEGTSRLGQGKRIRPLLLLLSTSAFMCDWERSLPAAAAVELLHNFSLIHDDIQDNSSMRRGRPTVWVKWGIPQAINAGDAMYSLAQLSIAGLRDGMTCETTVQVIERLNQACVHLTEGQYLDIAYEKIQIISLDDYWPMIRGKTAALFSACTSIGALLGGADTDQVNVMEAFGRSLGLAFQIHDDYLGIWGNSNQTGKSSQSDLIAGKKTFPIIYGLSKNQSFADRWKKGAIQPDELPEIITLLDHEGVKQFTQQSVDQLTQQAIHELHAASPNSNDAINAIIELTNQSVTRQF
jgi:geranylgeranyl diphosphate synthase type I